MCLLFPSMCHRDSGPLTLYFLLFIVNSCNDRRNTPFWFTLLIDWRILSLCTFKSLALRWPVTLLYPIFGNSWRIWLIRESKLASDITENLSRMLRPNSAILLSIVIVLTFNSLLINGTANPKSNSDSRGFFEFFNEGGTCFQWKHRKHPCIMIQFELSLMLC